jgi:L-lactate dehydrogenase complex protein LldG
MTRIHTSDLPDVPGELVREFVDHWLALSGDAWMALDGAADVRRAIVEAAAAMVPRSDSGRPRRVVTWSTEELTPLDLRGLLTPHGFDFATAPDPVATGSPDAPVDASREVAARTATRTAAAADLGITSCAWAAAETGTIALYATPSSGRLASLLPTVHLALVRPSRIVRTIPEGLALLGDYAAREGGFPSAVNLVSGPSRTGDIEGDLAVGAHGPVRAGVIIGEW